MKTKHRGIALIQILLIVAMLSIFAIHMTQTAKEQVGISTDLVSRMEAYNLLISEKNKLLFSLLTLNEEAIVTKIGNFNGKSFFLRDNVKVNIQDQAGLLNIHAINFKLLRRLLENKAIDAANIKQTIDTLSEWQEIDRLSPNSESKSHQRALLIPTLFELLNIIERNQEVFDVLLNNFSIEQPGYFNPLTSPEEIIYALFEGAVASRIIELRDRKELTPRLFTEITGMEEDEGVAFFRPRIIKLNIQSTVRDVTVKEELVLEINPNASYLEQPLNMLNVHN